MANILIAGCGDVGVALATRLIQDGDSVWGLRRNTGALPAGIAPFPADLASPLPAALPPELDAVVYLAAADQRSAAAYRAAYVDGPRHLLQRLAGDGQRPRRLVFVSSTSVYGEAEGGWVDEDSPANAEGFGPEALRAGEALVLGAGLPATVVRFTGIYGPGRSYLIDAVRAGRLVCCEHPPCYTNRIHRDDCASALHHVLRIADPAPLYLASDDRPASQCEVYDWLAARLGVARPARTAHGPGGGKRCSNRRLRDSGWTPAYPDFTAGYAALLDDA